jgi:hypothetical protein
MDVERYKQQLLVLERLFQSERLAKSRLGRGGFDDARSWRIAIPR